MAAIDRVWSLPEVLERLTDEDPDELLDTVASMQELSVEELAEMPLSEVLTDSVLAELPFSKSDIRAAWHESQTAVPESCPHDAVYNDYCIFHAPADAVDEEHLISEFLSVVNDPETPSMFVGARFPSLNLSNKRIQGDDAESIDLRYAEWSGTLSLSGIELHHELLLTGASIAAISMTDARFHEPVRAMATHLGYGDDRSGSEYRFANNYADFEGSVDATGATFHATADFKYAHFEPQTSFNSVRFGGLAMFNYAIFGDQLDTMHTEFVGKADFSKATFHDRAILTSTFHDNVMFSYATFHGPVELWNGNFESMVDCWGTQFRGPVDARYARFQGFVTIQEATFNNGADFHGVRFEESVELDRIQTPDSVIDLSEATIEAGSIHQSAPPAHFDLTDATLGNVTLSGPKDVPIFDTLRVVETDFSDFDFAAHRPLLDDDWTLHRFAPTETDSPTVSKLESTYLRARNGADESGDNTAASAFFLKEMQYRRKRLFTRFTDGSGVQNRAIGLGRWLTNWFFNVTCGYGERPLRTVGVSGIVVVAFAGIYRGLGILEPGASAIAYLTLSLQTFVALILGRIPTQDSLAVQFTGAFQAFTGAFLIALFVFALTRSVRR